MHTFKLLRALLFLSATVLAKPYKRVNAAAVASSSDATRSTSSASSADQSLPPVVKPNPRAGDVSLIQALQLAPTQGDRNKLLSQPGDFLYDFKNPPPEAVTTGKGGHTVRATADIFPALIGNGVSMTLGFIDACGLNTPHVHNRGTEINIAVEGRVVVNFIQENGARTIEHLLNKFQMTIIPQGSIHTEFNPDCEPAVFVAGFNNPDPGVEQIAQIFFALRPDIVAATLGNVSYVNGADVEIVKDILPANVVLGIESCLQKCGIQKRAKRDIKEFMV